MSYRIISGKLQFIADVPKAAVSGREKPSQTKPAFKDFLEKETAKGKGVAISNHAAERLKSRGIQLTEEDMKNIVNGLDKAAEKGCKDCVLLYNNVAFVANVKNRTIITAVDHQAEKGNVFTNIDGVVLL